MSIVKTDTLWLRELQTRGNFADGIYSARCIRAHGPYSGNDYVD